MKVCVYTIALNEEKHVERWYNSSKEADLHIIADTGSTDRTVEIARSLGIQVYNIHIKPWRFDDARNAALALVPSDADYCVIMDMDEALKRFEDKPWVKAGLEENAFKTPYEYAQFILKHEDEHTRLSFEDWKQMQDPQGDLFKNDQTGVYSEEQMRKDYEHYINTKAYHSVQEDPYISQPDVMVSEIPKNPDEHPDWAANTLYTLDKAPERDLIIGKALIEQRNQDNIPVSMLQRWKAYEEGNIQLTPHELELYNKHEAPLAKEINTLTKFIKKKNYTNSEYLLDTLSEENFSPRKLIPKKEEKYTKILNALTKGDFGIGLNLWDISLC